MNHEWLIEVVDSAGSPVTGASVALVASGVLASMKWPFAAVAATHKHTGAGKYEATVPFKPATGDFTLIVSMKGRSPVVQPLKIKEKPPGEFITSAAPRSAATVSASSEVKTSGKTKVRRARFKVTLYPSSELVTVSGTEYHNQGTQFRLFAESRRDDLRGRKLVDAGVIWTIFSMDTRSVENWVPAAGNGWLRVGQQILGPPDKITPGRQHSPVDGEDVSPVHVYEYLSLVGKTDPGRVLEVSVFSHSYPVGPILFDTFDTSPTDARDPADFDMRMKDFAPTNSVGWPNMPAAMAAKSSWHIWGCSATTHHKNLASEGHAQRKKKTADDVHFVVRTTLNDDSGKLILTLEERTTLARLRALFDRQFRSNTYMAVAAAHLKKPVFGAPPGVGSSFLQVGGRPFMLIQPENYGGLYAYFKAEFGPQFAPTSDKTDTGYIDYAALRTRAAPAAPAFSAEYYYFQVDMEKKVSTVLFANGKRASVAELARLKATPRNAFAAPGKSGQLYELRVSSDETKSVARFLQEDGSLFEVKKDATGKFNVLGAKL